ncbi:MULTISPECIES: TIGR02594 family protein [unclassified Bradyrhizobium]|uniref:TIGR02594 family protein n=1 Tax=unclassified Bradyrhizobium TaxID=2631580 RepID=UPI001BA8E0AA|nr:MULTISPECIES: TIGR02594 family protein [unclassified Bradyrhizobium]MBR1229722.1 TIGR02594 family protein [Bradyrhizobium sp. AUGA SZCCT0176]MBR1302362.1 TIGR02594 family protein [Bradyrhizobium sp. AUGA SZCCT0042]
MLQLFAFRRSLRVLALALCSVSIVVIATPASARPHHGAGRHVRGYHAGHHARHYARHHHRKIARLSRWERGVAQMQAGGFADANANVDASATFTDHNSTLTPPGGVMAPSNFGSSNVVAEARRYLGGNPTGRGSLWCARFMNMVLQHSGYRGTGSDMAKSFASYGQRVSGPQVGAIAVMTRGRGGGHVGVITGIDAKGNPIMISGNNGNRVREAPVSRGRIYAYVMPTS